MTPIHDWSRVDAGLFHHFHQRWIAAISDALNAGCLPPDYYALAEQWSAGREPDVLALHLPTGHAETDSGNGGTALATAPPKTRFVQQSDADAYAAKANRIVVRNVDGDVVAIIEIVSPGNKHSTSAVESFVKKAVDFLRAKINLLIIDLFPPTNRDPQGLHQLIWERIENDPFELPSDKPLTLATYSAGSCITAYIEPVAVGDQLPDMALFLTPESHVPAPLAATYETTWNVCPQQLKNAVLAAAR
jgi:hypothetical protein